MTLTCERHSARISKTTNDGLTRSGTGCFRAEPMWQQWASYVLCCWLAVKYGTVDVTLSL